MKANTSKILWNPGLAIKIERSGRILSFSFELIQKKIDPVSTTQEEFFDLLLEELSKGGQNE